MALLLQELNVAEQKAQQLTTIANASTSSSKPVKFNFLILKLYNHSNKIVRFYKRVSTKLNDPVYQVK